MFETVTVDQALRKGHRTITTPGLAILILFIALTIYLNVQFALPGWTIFAGLLLSFVVPLIYWCVMITKWRIWAFDNVRNVHELKSGPSKKI